MEIKYSRTKFDGYKFRAMLKIDYVHMLNGEPIATSTNITVYTTESEKSKIKDWALDRKSNKVTAIEVFHMASKEQDDRATEFITESLKNDW